MLALPIDLSHRYETLLQEQGIKTPKHEIDLVHERLKRLKEILR